MKKITILLVFLVTKTFAIDPMSGYQTTNIETKENLNVLFESLNMNYKRFKTTQCFNRAHYWSYQMYRNHGVASQKVFIYFTKKYVREIYGAWWFHVAPGVKYNNELHVLDPEFLNSAVPFEAWKNGALDHAIKRLTPIKIKYETEIKRLKEELVTLNSLSRNRISYIKRRLNWLTSELKRRLIDKARLVPTTEQNWPFKDGRKEILEINCPIITNYSEFKSAQETQYCFIQHANMYVWEPGELEKLEDKFENKNNFSNSEIYTSFKSTFRGRFPYRFEQN